MIGKEYVQIIIVIMICVPKIKKIVCRSFYILIAGDFSQANCFFSPGTDKADI